jgi:hypothetical protein
MHARKMHAHDMHAREVQRYAYKRHPSIGCTLVGCMPVRYVLIFESSFVVLDAEPGLARMSVLAAANANSGEASAFGALGVHIVLHSCCWTIVHMYIKLVVELID